MEITEDKEFRAQLLKRIEQREFKERTGVHTSDLVYCLNKTKLRRTNPLPIDDSTLLLFSLGWATQRWLTGQDKDVPEKEVDGIIVTLDALTDEGIPWELKCTFQSSKRSPAEAPYYIRQIMSQCYVTGVNTAMLSRLEVMGNWQSIFAPKEVKALDLPENRRPTLHAYKLTFTDKDLSRNWEWMQERKVLWLELLETGVLLPKGIAIPSGQDFECGRCAYKDNLCTL